MKCLQKMKNNFSYFVNELAAVWWEWMKADAEARDCAVDYKTRRECAEKCELLIARQYLMMHHINSFFSDTTHEQD